MRGEQRLADAERAGVQPDARLPGGDHGRTEGGPTRKRRSLFAFETIHTLRFAFLQRAGVIVHPDGYAPLDVGRSPAVMERFTEVDRLLKAA
jgi:hypothetical protein